ncbi:decapping and exoribonuclease protein-like isoform X2 [Lasioglossum baleicum]|uniref:decapping and exoribonuclease protein-like isoform X2 n=1 Tax=Lasioglossum baleicum TaxID=434251 RepID=UPI003FCD16CC
MGPTDQFTKPQIVGSYSIQGDRSYCSDLSQLKYYKEPENVYFNLDDNPPANVQIENEKLDFLLRWMSDNFDQIKVQHSDNATKRWLEPEIVCYRGLLTTLFSTPYDTEGWIVCASKFRGTIYLCGFDSDAKKLRISRETSYQKKCCSWGHKFEEYMLADSPFENPDLSIPPNGELCCMFKSMFGGTTFLYGAEIDGIRSSHRITDTRIGKDVELIELKTISMRAITRHGHIKYNRANTILKWWLQSYLVGIPRIVCGCRNDNGIVTEIREYKLARLADDFKHCWNFEACSSFLTGFLKRIKATVVRNYNECIYKFTYHPERKTIEVDELKPSPYLEYTFLHSWYIDAAKRHCETEDESTYD